MADVKKLNLAKHKRRLEIEMKEHELLRDFHKLRMNYHPLKVVQKVVESDAVQQNTNIAEKLETIIQDERFLSGFTTFQDVVKDLLVYFSSNVATKSISKSLANRRHKRRYRPTMKKR